MVCCFLKKKIIYLFIYCLAASGLSCSTQDLSLRRAGSSLQCTGFSLVVVRGLQSMWALQLQHAGSLVVAHVLSSCGMQTQLPRGMWDLSSLTRDRTGTPCIARWILNHWTTRKVPPPSKKKRVFKTIIKTGPMVYQGSTHGFFGWLNYWHCS